MVKSSHNRVTTGTGGEFKSAFGRKNRQTRNGRMTDLVFTRWLEPVGRIHFAGCHADNLPWGMDAATRSANRVARQIDKAS
jgi:monoamine oxidase